MHYCNNTSLQVQNSWFIIKPWKCFPPPPHLKSTHHPSAPSTAEVQHLKALLNKLQRNMSGSNVQLKRKYFSTSSPTPAVSWVFNLSHSDWCDVKSQGCFMISSLPSGFFYLHINESWLCLPTGLYFYPFPYSYSGIA